jgi:hypothetical protein
MVEKEVMEGIDSKLDTLIAGQADIAARMTNVESQQRELTQTVRGFNGTPGLVTEVYLLKERLKNHPVTCPYLESSGAQKDDAKQDEKLSESTEEKFVSWKWVVEKMTMPVLTALVLWVLLTLFPQILVHLGSAVK